MLKQFSLVISMFQCLGQVCTSSPSNDCRHYLEILSGETYHIYNQQFPYFYPPSTSCCWEAESPPGTIIVAECSLDLPSAKFCANDRLVFKLDNESYCGHSSFTKQAQTNHLTFDLVSSSQSSGGRFLCTLTVRKPCKCELKQETKIGKVQEFPSLALLMISRSEEVLCGASIISEWHALTGAYCHGGHELINLELLVGEHDVAEKKTNPSALYPLISFTQHPFYNSSTGHNDIAVLRTKKKIVFDIGIGPICLPFKCGTYEFSEKMVTIFGTEITLQKVEAYVISNDQCKVMLADDGIVPSQTQICTVQEVVSCAGYSGMPIIFQDRCSGSSVLIGIMPSVYTSCASTSRPAVSTRVVPYLDWIVSVTGLDY